MEAFGHEEYGFGITVEYTAQKTPQQNGMVECAFATLYGKIWALNSHAGFKKEKQENHGQSVLQLQQNLTIYLLRNHQKKCLWKTLWRKNPIEQHLRIFGEVGIVTKQKIRESGVN